MAEVLEILRKAIEEVTKTVKIETPLTPEEAAKGRLLLSSFVRQFWASPLGLKIKQQLQVSAQEYGSHLEALAKELELDKKYKAIAERVALDKKYKMVWGKPAT
jgi:hypothetical protein